MVEVGTLPSTRELRLLRRAALSGGQGAIDRARRDFPRNKDVLKYSGIFHYRRNELTAAQEALLHAFTADPGDAEAAVFLMRVYYKAGADDKCEAVALDLLRLAPGHSDALRSLGRIYNKQRAWVQAASVWQRLATTTPDDAEAPFQAARAFERQGCHADAIFFADRALAANPNNGQAARIKIDAVIAAGDGNYWPIVDAIAPYYRLEPGRALGLVQRLARSNGIELCAAMTAALVEAYPDDDTVRRFASAIAEAWQIEAMRWELQGQHGKAASFASALRMAKLEVNDILSPEPAVAAAGDLPSGAAPDWFTNLSSWAGNTWRSYRRTFRKHRDTIRTQLATAAARCRMVVPLSKGTVTRHPNSLNTNESADANELMPQQPPLTRQDLINLRRLGSFPAKAAAWSEVAEVQPYAPERQFDDEEAPQRTARHTAETVQHEKATEAGLPETITGHLETIQTKVKMLLASGAIDDAATAAVPLVLESPDQARDWFARQPEVWTALVSAVAFSRAVIAAPERRDLLLTADLARIDCLGDGYEHEIGGDFVSAFIGFYAAALVRPADCDAAFGVARVKDRCLAQIRTDEARAPAVTPATAGVLLALCG